MAEFLPDAGDGLQCKSERGILANGGRCHVRMVGSRSELDLALRHHGGSGTGLVGLIDPSIDDFDALQILLNDFLTRHFDVLLGIASGSLADAVDHVFFNQDPDLLGEVGAGGQFRHPLADDRAFGHIALAPADEVLV